MHQQQRQQGQGAPQVRTQAVRHTLPALWPSVAINERNGKDVSEGEPTFDRMGLTSSFRASRSSVASFDSSALHSADKHEGENAQITDW